MDNQDENSKNKHDTSKESHRDSHKDEERGGISVGDTLKKLLTAGVSAAFMTEETIRGFVSEAKLPKETLNLLLQGAAKSKEEITNRVTNEVIKVINRIDFVKEASRFVEEHKFRISAEIDVIRKDKTPSQAATGEDEVETKISIKTSKT